MPKSYTCPFARIAPVLDGKLTDPAWEAAPWTDDFVDILGDQAPVPRFRTRAKFLWDENYLYVAAELEEPHVWATLTEHDSVIFQDNDFEVFIDPDGDNHLYAELEINALNTTWDLLLVKPYRNHGPAIHNWEMHGLRTATHVRGTLNDASDTDQGWTVEMAIPWSSFEEITRVACPPEPGDVWRLNMSRVEWITDIVDGQYVKRPGLPEDNWVWSPQGVVDMHQPEQWGLLQFAKDETLPRPTLDPDQVELMRFYHAQIAYRAEHGSWDPSLVGEGVQFECTSSQFLARKGAWTVDHESRLVASPPFLAREGGD